LVFENDALDCRSNRDVNERLIYFIL
jgi:hypothetical protein